jgi:ankyrin repeat protein
MINHIVRESGLVPDNEMELYDSESYEPDDYLMLVVRLNSIDLLELLIANGANVNCKNCLVLRMCCEMGLIEIVKYLISIKARLDGTAFLAAIDKGNIEIAKLLLDNGVYVNYCDSSALVRASLNNDIEMVKLLIEYGININARNGYCITWTAANGFIEVVQLLLESGCSIECEISPLRTAIGYGHFECAVLLIKWGFLIDKEIVETSINYADPRILQIFIDLDIDLTYNSNAFFKECCKRGAYEYVKMLLQNFRIEIDSPIEINLRCRSEIKKLLSDCNIPYVDIS